MNTFQQIESISQAIASSRNVCEAEYKKQFELRTAQLDLIIKYVFEEKLLENGKWCASLNRSRDNTIYIESRTELVDEKLVELLQTNYHDQHQLKPGVKIFFDDNDVSITFENAETAKEFLTENKLNIDVTNILKLAEESKARQACAEAILSIYGNSSG